MALSASLLHLLLQLKHIVEKSLEPESHRTQKKSTDSFCALPFCYFFLKGKEDVLFRQGLNPPCTTKNNRLVNRKKKKKQRGWFHNSNISPVLEQDK